MPEGVQGVIIAELNETEYTDPSYECSTTRSVRTVILGFSATSRNGFGELRKAAANFPQTAHLSEYDPKNEHRYPVFTLGKSPKYGWSVCKLTHYTREGYIDRLAYIAGNEENICLPEPKDEKRAERTETSVQGGFIIVDYSEKAIAVFGDTKPVKDALHALGGRFNARLTHDGQKKAGWIFQRGRGAAASRKGRINVEHGAARRPTIPKNHGTRNRLFQTDDTELSRRTGTGGRTFRTPIRQPEKEH